MKSLLLGTLAALILYSPAAAQDVIYLTETDAAIDFSNAFAIVTKKGADQPSTLQCDDGVAALQAVELLVVRKGAGNIRLTALVGSYVEFGTKYSSIIPTIGGGCSDGGTSFGPYSAISDTAMLTPAEFEKCVTAGSCNDTKGNNHTYEASYSANGDGTPDPDDCRAFFPGVTEPGCASTYNSSEDRYEAWENGGVFVLRGKNAAKKRCAHFNAWCQETTQCSFFGNACDVAACDCL